MVITAISYWQGEANILHVYLSDMGLVWLKIGSYGNLFDIINPAISTWDSSHPQACRCPKILINTNPKLDVWCYTDSPFIAFRYTIIWRIPIAPPTCVMCTIRPPEIVNQRTLRDVSSLWSQKIHWHPEFNAEDMGMWKKCMLSSKLSVNFCSY